jgi:hypothetical protein
MLLAAVLPAVLLLQDAASTPEDRATFNTGAPLPGFKKFLMIDAAKTGAVSPRCHRVANL